MKKRLRKYLKKKNKRHTFFWGFFIFWPDGGGESKSIFTSPSSSSFSFTIGGEELFSLSFFLEGFALGGGRSGLKSPFEKKSKFKINFTSRKNIKIVSNKGIPFQKITSPQTTNLPKQRRKWRQEKPNLFSLSENPLKIFFCFFDESIKREKRERDCE